MDIKEEILYSIVRSGVNGQLKAEMVFDYQVQFLEEG